MINNEIQYINQSNQVVFTYDFYNSIHSPLNDTLISTTGFVFKGNESVKEDVIDFLQDVEYDIQLLNGNVIFYIPLSSKYKFIDQKTRALIIDQFSVFGLHYQVSVTQDVLQIIKESSKTGINGEFLSTIGVEPQYTHYSDDDIKVYKENLKNKKQLSSYLSKVLLKLSSDELYHNVKNYIKETGLNISIENRNIKLFEGEFGKKYFLINGIEYNNRKFLREILKDDETINSFLMKQYGFSLNTDTIDTYINSEIVKAILTGAYEIDRKEYLKKIKDSKINITTRENNNVENIEKELDPEIEKALLLKAYLVATAFLLNTPSKKIVWSILTRISYLKYSNSNIKMLKKALLLLSFTKVGFNIGGKERFFPVIKLKEQENTKETILSSNFYIQDNSFDTDNSIIKVDGLSSKILTIDKKWKISSRILSATYLFKKVVYSVKPFKIDVKVIAGELLHWNYKSEKALLQALTQYLKILVGKKLIKEFEVSQDKTYIIIK